MIARELEEKIKEKFFNGKVILLFGPRQVGKTTLAQHLLKNERYLHLNGDEADVRQLLNETTSAKLRSLCQSHKIVLIDEAQRIMNIGLTLKIFVDQLKDIQVIATGSSALELASTIKEPLTGRKYEFNLLPLSFKEMVNHHGLLEEKRMLEYRMLYGYYPEIVSNGKNAKEHLQLLTDSYLYKDLLSLEMIKKPLLLEKILQALAMQIGSEVSYSELGKIVGADNETVEKYIHLLEQAFVIFRLPAFKRNMRTEIKKGKKIYFYDCGIRNAVINNFENLEFRQDKGALFENFMISERIKYLSNQMKRPSKYFWRTTQQQEIDYIEAEGNSINAFEFKWKEKYKIKIPKSFSNNYTEATFKTIDLNSIEDFLM